MNHKACCMANKRRERERGTNMHFHQTASFNYPRQCNEEALIYRRVDETLAMIRLFDEGSKVEREEVFGVTPLIRVERL